MEGRKVEESEQRMGIEENQRRSGKQLRADEVSRGGLVLS